MSDWKRKTQEVPFESLLPETIAAINKHIEQYNLGPILSDTIMCIETEQRKRKIYWYIGEQHGVHWFG